MGQPSPSPQEDYAQDEGMPHAGHSTMSSPFNVASMPARL